MTENDPVRDVSERLAAATRNRERSAAAAAKAREALADARGEEAKILIERGELIRDDQRDDATIARVVGLSRTRVGQIRGKAKTDA